MIVVADRAGSVDGLRLVRLVVEEVEVGSLLVQSGVGDGDADHGAGEFAKKKPLSCGKKEATCSRRDNYCLSLNRYVQGTHRAAGNVTVSSAPPADSCTLTALSTSTA